MSVFSLNFKPIENYTEKSLRIDNSFYEKLKQLSENKYEASINQLVNVAIENLFNLKEIKLYVSTEKIDYIQRSYLIRDSLLNKLNQLKEKTGLSVASLINIAIYEALKSEEVGK